ncbi:hypothetical protein [Deinococcus fonticola]|uniref:hypothetical protein n=1 Tax=Deinococcus fonticola TaxID=2528713 RepID=UPI00142FA1D7|nr:hypothetical protein [Deinococcus fonticola]
MTVRGWQAFRDGHYNLVVAELRGRMDLTPDELALLGRAELRLGLFYEAELHVYRPHLAGSGAGTAGLLAFLARSGQQRALHDLLAQTPPANELASQGLDARAWTALLLGDSVNALAWASQAAARWLTQGREQDAGVSLAVMAFLWGVGGNLSRAEQGLRMALSVLPEIPDAAPRLRALALLSWVQGMAGRLTDAKPTLAQAEALLLKVQDVEAMQIVLHVRYHLAQWAGETAPNPLDVLGEHLHESDVWRVPFTYSALESALRDGEYAAAFLHLATLKRTELHPVHLAYLEGQLCARLGETERACELLRGAARVFGEQADRLHEAHCQYLLAELLDDLTLRKEALETALKTPLISELRRLCWPVPGPAHWPADAGYAARHQAYLRHLQPPPSKPTVTITTLGTVAVERDGRQVNAPAELLSLLLLKGKLTRSELELHLYPERSASAAESAVKQDIYRVRQVLGRDAITSSGMYHAKYYALSPDYRWQLDALRVLRGCESFDSVEVFSVLRGPFLPACEHEWALEFRVQLELMVERMVEGLGDYYQKNDMPLNAHGLAMDFVRSYPHRLDGWHERLALLEAQLSPVP